MLNDVKHCRRNKNVLFLTTFNILNIRRKKVIENLTLNSYTGQQNLKSESNLNMKSESELKSKIRLFLTA